MRSVPGTYPVPMAMMTVVTDAPIASTSKNASIRPGIDNHTSTRRSLARSNLPPMYPVAMPHMAPAVVPRNTEHSATNREIRAP